MAEQLYEHPDAPQRPTPVSWAGWSNGLLAVALTAVLTVTGWLALSGPDDEVDRAAVTEAAGKVLKDAFSYSYRTLDVDLTAATAGMTKSLATEYRSTYEKVTIPLATSNKAVVEAVVQGIGVAEVRSDGSVIVLAYLDQLKVENSATAKDTSVTPSKLRVVLVQEGSRWLVNELQPF